MRTEVKAVVGTNAWGDALYGKMLRGSYVEEDVIREAVQTAIDEDIAMFDTARDYGLGKGQPMVEKLESGKKFRLHLVARKKAER